MKLLHTIVVLCLALGLALAEPADEESKAELVKASKQFSLNTLKDGSACFLSCHTMAVSTIRLPNRDTNFPMAITLNCQFDSWVNVVANCMTSRCVSAPDYAYALEYGTRFCKRAGVDVKFPIPQWFLDSPGGEWYNATIASSTRPVTTPLGPTIVVIAAAGAIALTLL